MVQQFQLNTLHRSKYMLSFFILLFIAGGLGSLLPFKEIYKIIIVLFTIPAILFLAVKWSIRPSIWTLSEDMLTIQFGKEVLEFNMDDIDFIQSLTRSGGNLYVFKFHKKRTQRFWRNKLFQGDDDQTLLHQALLQHRVEFYKF